MTAEAFYSDHHRCWFVPVTAEFMTDAELEEGVEPVRIQFRHRQLLITRLETTRPFIDRSRFAYRQSDKKAKRER